GSPSSTATHRPSCRTSSWRTRATSTRRPSGSITRHGRRRESRCACFPRRNARNKGPRSRCASVKFPARRSFHRLSGRPDAPNLYLMIAVIGKSKRASVGGSRKGPELLRPYLAQYLAGVDIDESDLFIKVHLNERNVYHIGKVSKRCVIQIETFRGKLHRH